MDEETRRVQLKVGGMGCSFCSRTIEKAYRRTPGVLEAHVSLAHEEALVVYDPKRCDAGELRGLLERLGYRARDPDRFKAREEQISDLRQERKRLFIAGIGAATASLLMAGMLFELTEPWWCIPTLLMVAVVTVFGAGSTIIHMAFQSFRRGILNQHVLLEIGALGAFLGGVLGTIGEFASTPALARFPAAQFFSVATFLVAYHILSGYVSKLVQARASEAVDKLLDLQPHTAILVDEDGEREVSVDEIAVGERVRVHPGERIPVDGIVLSGRSAVNESLVTGESLPVDKAEGSEVIGGSINASGTLLIRCSRVGESSFLQTVARAISEARAMKPGILELVDIVLARYVPAILIIGVATLIGWSAVAWILDDQTLYADAVFATLAVFVMGYPCAIGMATPLALIRGGGEAARRGVLMRSGQAFAKLRTLDTAVFDKTGTLTVGRPGVTDVITITGSRSSLLQSVAAVERHSEHPLARALVSFSEAETGLPAGNPGIGSSQDSSAAGPAADRSPIPEVIDFQSVSGGGVRAQLVSGVLVHIGSYRFLREEGVDIGERSRARDLESCGKSIVAVALDHTIAGVIALADTARSDAAATIRELSNRGIATTLLSGDNQNVAEAIGAETGIEYVIAEVRPNEKAARIKSMQDAGHRVLMVGDGINDAPALMQADVGIAIGAGTDIAIDSADIVLTHDGLSGVIEAIDIGRRSYRKTVENVVIAFLFNGVGVPFAAAGLLAPAWAMAAMIASVSAVLANSFLGRKFRQGTT